MKNFFRFSFAVVFCSFLFSCSEVTEEAGIISTKIGSDCIILSVPYMENCVYINIFRKIANTEDSELNIGQIKPASDYVKSYTFSDTFAFIDEDYQYCARYKIGNEYKSTDWSDIASISTGGRSETLKPEVTGTGVSLYYDKSNNSLSLKNSEQTETTFSIDVPDPELTTDYNLCIIVTNGSSTTTFPLVPAKGTSFTQDTAPLALSSILTTGYFNKEIEITGVICQNIIETRKDNDPEGTLRYTTIYWSYPLEIGNGISITGDVNSENKFKIEYGASDENNSDYNPIKNN